MFLDFLFVYKYLKKHFIKKNDIRFSFLIKMESVIIKDLLEDGVMAILRT